ncbi:MAG TPA: YbhB/YbcL family Raf kinase inhibitor-like protein [Acidimicrobiales bacterium]|nr:YbhB/YbcL family Raf kinase inhibitor-like protein [Acidimicrobiales bacterium]
MRWALIAPALVLGLAGCGDDGRELREPSADQTTTSASTTSTTSTTTPTTDVAAGTGGGTDDSGSSAASSAPAAAATLRLTSPAFGEGELIPPEYTCIGDDVSPPLAWSGVPEGTVELALVVRDPDADGFVHWVVTGLPPRAEGLARGNPPAEAVEALNDFGREGWSGPCPPSGTHDYDFRLYALGEASRIAPRTDGAQAAEQLESAPVLASAALSGTAAAP